MVHRCGARSYRPRAGWWTTNDRRNSSQLCNLNKKRPKRIMVEILAPGAANVKLNNNRILRLQSLESLVCARARKQVNNPIGCSMQRLPPSPVEVWRAFFKGFPQSLGVQTMGVCLTMRGRAHPERTAPWILPCGPLLALTSSHAQPNDPTTCAFSPV